MSEHAYLQQDSYFDNPYIQREQNSLETVIPFNYKYLMISFLIIKYFWEQYINLRQLKRNLIKDIPDQLKKYRISTNEFLLSQSYSFDKITFQMLALSIRMAVDVLSIMCNLLPFIWENVHVIFPFVSLDSQFQRALAYTLIQAFKSKAFQVPISAYQTFVIEKKYNFTNKTVQLFIYDLFVEAILMLIIFPPIIYGYLHVVYLGGQYFYIFLQIFVICITIILTWIHPNLIAPLFNKFTQLKDTDLRLKIFTLAAKNNIRISNVYVINSSVRTAHSNAYLYGLGTQKVIVLYDSLLQSLSKQQILAVVMHEMGHSYSWHSLKKLLIYLIQVLSMFKIFSQFIKNESVFISFGFTTRSVFICTALYFHMFQPLTSVFNTLLLVITRKFQFEADSFACQQGYGEQLKIGLMKLFKQSTSTVRPDVLFAWIKHSHPSIYQRIQNIEIGLQKRKKKYDDAYRQQNRNKLRSRVVINDSKVPTKIKETRALRMNQNQNINIQKSTVQGNKYRSIRPIIRRQQKKGCYQHQDQLPLQLQQSQNSQNSYSYSYSFSSSSNYSSHYSSRQSSHVDF